MRISDLKSGEHFVKLRNGDIAMVLGRNLVDIAVYFSLEDYNEDMRHDVSENLDIMKICKITELPMNLCDIDRYFDKQVIIIDNNGLETTWERTEKIELTDIERVILENIDETYQWIVREEDGFLWVFDKKPIKDNDEGYWYLGDETNYQLCSMELFQHLFDFVQWSDDEPKYIPDLLKGE